MLYFIKNSKIKNLLIISFVYLISQGFLLIVSGRWWDDWCFYLQEDFALNLMAFNMGRPTLLYIVKFLKLFPEPFYRILTFIIFYYCSLFLYRILVQGFKLKENIAFWITLIFITVPINPDRIMFCIFPYSFGLFFFVFAINLFLNTFYASKGVMPRIACLIGFLFSFILNSNLFFYGILFIIIIYKNKNIKCLFRYIDFIIMPIMFFIIKNKCFPTAGGYAGYNSVSLIKLIHGMILLPFNSFVLFIRTLNNYINFNIIILIAFFGFFVMLVFLYNIKKMYLYIKESFLSKKMKEILIEAKEKINFNIILIIIGAFLLMIGIFPYVVVRQGVNFTTGRDAILAPFGLSIILYSCLDILFNKSFKKYAMLLFILLGVLYFNFTYLNYQKGYYQIKALQYQIKKNNNLTDIGKNLLINSNDGFCGGNSGFYIFNRAYYEVSGKQDKFISERSGFNYLKKEKFDNYFIDSHNYGMNDYIYTDDNIDAVLDFSFKCSLLSTLKIKMLEFVSFDLFNNEIKKRSDLKIYESNTDKYNAIVYGLQ